MIENLHAPSDSHVGYIIDIKMGPPETDHSRESLIWALWHNIDPQVLAAYTEETADTISVQSYQVAYKHTPSNAFPCRKSQYAETVRSKAQQNAARTRYSSTAAVPASPAGEEEIILQARSTTLSEAPFKAKLYKSDTFLTEMPDYYAIEAETAERIRKICMPAFLPTIQATTHTKYFGKSKSSEVRKYLARNELTARGSVTKSYTAESYDTDGTLTSMSVLRKSVLPRELHTTPAQKTKKRKTSKYKSKYKHTGNKKKKTGKLYVGKNRDYSTSHNSNQTTSAKSFHSFVTPQEDLVNHFSRISMRQVQATLNNNKLALPSLS